MQAPTSKPLTRHARFRGAQRGISRQKVDLVLNYGRRIHAGGAVHCFFGDREARQNPHLGSELIEQLSGMVVVLDRTSDVVLTAYRNRNAPRRIRKLPSWLATTSSEPTLPTESRHD